MTGSFARANPSCCGGGSSGSGLMPRTLRPTSTTMSARPTASHRGGARRCDPGDIGRSATGEAGNFRVLNCASENGFGHLFASALRRDRSCPRRGPQHLGLDACLHFPISARRLEQHGVLWSSAIGRAASHDAARAPPAASSSLTSCPATVDDCDARSQARAGIGRGFICPARRIPEASSWAAISSFPSIRSTSRIVSFRRHLRAWRPGGCASATLPD